MSEKQILTNAKTITGIVEYFVMTQYVPSIQREMERFLADYYKKQKLLDDVQEITGFILGGDVGTFHIQEPTEAFVENIRRAFSNQLSDVEESEMKRIMLARLQTKREHGQNAAN